MRSLSANSLQANVEGAQTAASPVRLEDGAVVDVQGELWVSSTALTRARAVCCRPFTSAGDPARLSSDLLTGRLSGETSYLIQGGSLLIYFYFFVDFCACSCKLRK